MIKNIKAYKCSDKKLFTNKKKAINHEIASKHLGPILFDNDPDLCIEDAVHMAYTYIKNINKINKAIENDSHEEETTLVFLTQWLVGEENFQETRYIESLAEDAAKFILNDIEFINSCIEDSRFTYDFNLD